MHIYEIQLQLIRMSQQHGMSLKTSISRLFGISSNFMRISNVFLFLLRVFHVSYNYCEQKFQGIYSISAINCCKIDKSKQFILWVSKIQTFEALNKRICTFEICQNLRFVKIKAIVKIKGSVFCLLKYNLNLTILDLIDHMQVFQLLSNKTWGKQYKEKHKY